jgi:hypothetical protein
MPIGNSGVANYANTTQGTALNVYAPGGLGGSGEVVQYNSTALAYNYATTPQIDSRLTFTRSTTGTVVDFEGLVKTAKVNEVRFPGARRVENLVPNSATLTAAAGWALSSITSAQTAIAPDGTTTAWVFTATGAHGQFFKLLTVPSGATIVSAFWLRRNTGTGAVNLFNYQGNSSADITSALSSTWKRFSIKSTAASTSCYVGIDVAVSGDKIEIWSPLVENVTGQSNQNPSADVSIGVLSYPYHGAGVDGVKYFTTTNGNTVASNVVTEAAGTPLINTITLLAEEARTNLLLIPATPATQNITTTAQTYTVSMWGTGTCTLSGTATGTLTGTGATTRVSLTVTATAGTLTLTFAGTNTNGQFEAGASMSSFIPNNTARAADVASFTGAGLSWYNTQQGTFVITASGQAFRTPSPFGTFNLTLPTAGTYALQYNNAVTDGSTYLYTAAGGATPTEYTGIAVPTTILLLNGGLVNISNFTYYASALPTATIVGMLT